MRCSVKINLCIASAASEEGGNCRYTPCSLDIWISGRFFNRAVFLYLRVPTFGHTRARSRRGWRLSRVLILAASRSRFPSRRIRAGEMPLSLCNTALGIVLQTGRATRRARWITLSIRLQRWVVYGVTIPFAARRVIPGYHISTPYVATGTTHILTAVTKGPGAAPRITEFKRRVCWAIFSAFPHHVATWFLNVRWESRCSPSQRICCAGSIVISQTIILHGVSWWRVWKWISSDFSVSNSTAFSSAHSSKLFISRWTTDVDSVIVQPIPNIPMSSAWLKWVFGFPLRIDSATQETKSVADRLGNAPNYWAPMISKLIARDDMRLAMVFSKPFPRHQRTAIGL